MESRIRACRRPLSRRRRCKTQTLRDYETSFYRVRLGQIQIVFFVSPFRLAEMRLVACGCYPTRVPSRWCPLVDWTSGLEPVFELFAETSHVIGRESGLLNPSLSTLIQVASVTMLNLTVIGCPMLPCSKGAEAFQSISH
jgi:hypothetical protein